MGAFCNANSQSVDFSEFQVATLDKPKSIEVDEIKFLESRQLNSFIDAEGYIWINPSGFIKIRLSNCL